MAEDLQRGAAGSVHPDFLTLEEVTPSSFSGVCEPSAPARAFGGQVAAQALLAAGSTVPTDRAPHSLHGYFVRRGNPRSVIEYQVEVTRDGGRFSNRLVRAMQDGEVIFHLSASFHEGEFGPEHAEAMPDVPPPSEVPSIEEWYLRRPDDIDSRFVRYWDRHPIEVRFLEEPPQLATITGPRSARQLIWMRATALSSPSSLINACALTYGSDLVVLGTVLLPHGLPGSGSRTLVTSLDHSLWFHAPVDMGQWHLLELVGPVARGGRGFSLGRIFTEAGELVASVAQEGLIRRLELANGQSPFDIVDELPELI